MKNDIIPALFIIHNRVVPVPLARQHRIFFQEHLIQRFDIQVEGTLRLEPSASDVRSYCIRTALLLLRRPYTARDLAVHYAI